MVYNAIRNLVEYGLETGLITENDRTYAINQLLEALRLDEYEEPAEAEASLRTVLVTGICLIRS